MKSPSSGVGLNITEFKARCLRLLAETGRKGKSYVITKRGTPIARVVPFEKRQGSRRGRLKGLATIQGDIVHFETTADWEVLKP